MKINDMQCRVRKCALHIDKGQDTFLREELCRLMSNRMGGCIRSDDVELGSKRFDDVG